MKMGNNRKNSRIEKNNQLEMVRRTEKNQTVKDTQSKKNQTVKDTQSKKNQEAKDTQTKKRHRIPALRTFLLAIVGILIGVNVYLWNAENLLGNRLPMPFGYGAAVVLSGSMEPALSVGDLVIIRETQEVSEGDVIVYGSGSELIIHRVITVSGDEILTQGDANTIADAPITAESVKGVLVLAIPGAGTLVQLLRQPWMVALILVAAFVLMELSNRRSKAADKEELAQLEAKISTLKEELAQDVLKEEPCGDVLTEEPGGEVLTEEPGGGALKEERTGGAQDEKTNKIS